MTWFLFSEVQWWKPLAAIVLVTGVAYLSSRKAHR